MNENIVELLLYLFENYIYENDTDDYDRPSIHNGLIQAGFTSSTIKNAFSWMDELSNDIQSFQTMHINEDSFRVFSMTEQLKIDSESIDFILYLYNSGILDHVQREILINALMKLETNQFDEEDLQWLVLMVLFLQPSQEQAFANLEALMFESDEIYEH